MFKSLPPVKVVGSIKLYAVVVGSGGVYQIPHSKAGSFNKPVRMVSNYRILNPSYLLPNNPNPLRWMSL